MWVDRSGREEEIKAMPLRPYSAARLSPDGSRVAVQIDDADKDIWVWDLAREMLTRVTTDPGLDQSPLWTPDGHGLIFTSQAGGVRGALFRQAADGTGIAERLTDSPTIRRATAFVPDGSAVLYNDGADIMMLTLGGDRRVRPVVQTPQAERTGVISPDGRWLAYAGLDSGTPQIFVRPFPNVDDARTQVSTAGGSEPLWARNGRELFYMALDGTVMSAAVSPGATWQSQSPMPVVDGRHSRQRQRQPAHIRRVARRAAIPHDQEHSRRRVIGELSADCCRAELVARVAAAQSVAPVILPPSPGDRT